MKFVTDLARFEAKFEKRATGCWEWKRGGSARHRPCFRLGGKAEIAARASYLLFRGEIPAGLLVCHHCDNPVCVNPDHLFLGTHADNVHDFIAKGLHLFKTRKPASEGRYRRGAQHCRVTASPERLAEIAARVMSGESQVSIARDIGVSPATVSRVANGQHWSVAT